RRSFPTAPVAGSRGRRRAWRSGARMKPCKMDPASNTWSPIAAMQSVRYGLAAATGPDGRIYAIGGYDGFGNIATVEAYDLQADPWTFVAAMNYAHAIRATATAADGRIYVFGGEVAYPPLGVVETYMADVATNSRVESEFHHAQIASPRFIGVLF